MLEIDEEKHIWELTDRILQDKYKLHGHLWADGLDGRYYSEHDIQDAHEKAKALFLEEKEELKKMKG